MFDFPWYYYVLFVLGLIVLIPILFAAALAPFVGDFIAQAWERNVPQSIVTEDGVTVNYRFAGSLSFLPKSPEEEKAFIEKTDAVIRRIIKNNRLIDSDGFAKFETTLKIKVLSVQTGPPTP